MLEIESKVDFKGVAPDLIFPQNHNNNSHFDIGRIDLVGKGVGGGARSSNAPNSNRTIRVNPEQKILSAPKDGGLIMLMNTRTPRNSNF